MSQQNSSFVDIAIIVNSILSEFLTKEAMN